MIAPRCFEMSLMVAGCKHQWTVTIRICEVWTLYASSKAWRSSTSPCITPAEYNSQRGRGSDLLWRMLLAPETLRNKFQLIFAPDVIFDMRFDGVCPYDLHR